MAPKRPSPLEEPPAASSSEEEESEEENEEEEGDTDEESEEEQQKQHHKKASSPPPSTPPVGKKLKKPESHPQPQPSSSDDGSDSESDSDSDTPPRLPSSAPDPNVKPIASKPMDDASKLKKPRSKPGPKASATPIKSASKRTADNDRVGDGKDSKRAKKKVPDAAEEKKSGDDAKKQLFQRLWSEDDEIEILKGMIEYSSKKGADPSADMNAFHDFIKKSLHVDVTRAQLGDKIRRLKKKYENNLGKGKKGEDRTFSKAHEQKAYELSKKVWGSGGEANNGGVEQSETNNGKAKRVQKDNKRLTPLQKEQLLSSLRDPKETPKKEVEQHSGPSHCVSEWVRFSKGVGAAGFGEDLVKQGLDLIAGSRRSELEEKWRKLQMTEMELFLRRVELIGEQTKLVLDACKSAER
ncbi:hypothetical protein L1049_010092 [Liquidambar formosana]|uniref:Uncharacterized protein n=1 Tax=Liquidambar formosana TaxID=63359 RepID=A0AAP0R6R1_LIQFO